MFNKILVAVDGSSCSNRAVDVAVDLANRYKSQVFLLHVIRNLSLPKEILAMISSGEVTESRMELLEDSAEIILGNAKEKFDAVGYPHVKTEYIVGNPAATIANYASENDIDLLIIGYRGISSESEGVTGGVARKLLNISAVSCLLVI